MVKAPFTLPGGIRPRDNKVDTSVITPAPLFHRYAIPLSTPFSRLNSLPCVAVGDTVKKYQCIAHPQDNYGTAAHAPTSGIITHIGPESSAHISGLKTHCIHIQADGLDTAAPPIPLRKDDDFARHLQAMGIVGLGGAMFPAHHKTLHACHTLIINCAECEPYISCDEALIRHAAEALLAAIDHLGKRLGITHILIGIEDHKTQAINTLNTLIIAQHYPIQCIVVPTRYPSGSAKQLAYLLTGQQIPYGQHLSDAGILCFNPATVLAIEKAIAGYPLIERITTLAGDITTAGNYQIRIGTYLSDLLHYYDIQKKTVILGGSLMGYPLHTEAIPIEKGHNCFLCFDEVKTTPEMPCIRCHECARVCPVSLQPQELYWYSRGKQFDKAAESYGLFDCIECSACSYVCPSHIPLVAYYQYAKSEMRIQQRTQDEASAAKMRFEARAARLQKRQEERLQRLQAQSQRLRDSDEEKQKLVQSAIQRIQDKKRQHEPTPPPPEQE